LDNSTNENMVPHSLHGSYPMESQATGKESSQQSEHLEAEKVKRSSPLTQQRLCCPNCEDLTERLNGLRNLIGDLAVASGYQFLDNRYGKSKHKSLIGVQELLNERTTLKMVVLAMLEHREEITIPYDLVEGLDLNENIRVLRDDKQECFFITTNEDAKNVF